MLFLCERQHEEERSRGIIKTTFWLMIHFSVKIGLNLYFFSGNDLPKKQMNASKYINNHCRHGLLWRMRQRWRKSLDRLIGWLGKKKFCSQTQLIVVLSNFDFLIKSASLPWVVFLPNFEHKQKGNYFLIIHKFNFLVFMCWCRDNLKLDEVTK